MSDIPIEALSSMPIGELAALSAGELMHLAKQVEYNLKQAKLAKGWLDNALKLKYEEQTIRLRQQTGRTSGVIHFDDGKFNVTASLPKKVSWNQETLRNLVAQIEHNGDEVDDYVNIVYDIPERRYNAWPQSIRDFFNQARTFAVGKQTFTLQRHEETL